MTAPGTSGGCLLVDHVPGETRAALVEDGRLAEIAVARPAAPDGVEDVVLGRVRRVVPGLKAAFVDIGVGPPGFLPLPDPPPAEGDAVMVQVERAAIDDKGPRLSMAVTLTGRWLVLTPDRPGVNLSRRLDNAAERRRLDGAARRLVRAGEGLVVRRGAEGVDEAALAAELETLRAGWTAIGEAGRGARAPALLAVGPDPVARLLRDRPDLPVTVDGFGLPDGVRRRRPDATVHRRPGRLFADEGVDDALDDALAATVPLPSGGRLIFAETPALVAVDVDTGGAQNPLQANLEAAAELPRQLRLRRLGGMVVIDFVSLNRRRDRHRVLGILRRAFDADPSRVHLAGFTTLGLVELTRRRDGPSLGALLARGCPACAGRGRGPSPQTVAADALRAAAREAAARPGCRLRLTAAAAVTAAGTDALAAEPGWLGGLVRFVADPAAAVDVVRIEEEHSP